MLCCMWWTFPQIVMKGSAPRPPIGSKTRWRHAALSILVSVGVFLAGLPHLEAAHALFPYIKATVPVPGGVAQLVSSPAHPNYLFALVQTGGPPKALDQAGLYVFDTSGAGIPRQLAYLPVTNPREMDLSPTGNTLVVYSAFINYKGADPKAWHGLLVLDVSDPLAIREVGRTAIDILNARLAVDGTHVFVAERGLLRQNDPEYFFSVYSVSPTTPPQLLTQVKRKDARADGFFPTPDGKHLLVAGSSRNIFAYDISDPAAPTLEFEATPGLGVPHAIGTDGRVYLLDGDNLVVATLYPTAARLGTIHGRFTESHLTYISADNTTAYLVTLDNTLSVLDLRDPRAPKTVAQYSTPDYIGSAIPGQSHGLIYVGLLGSIAVIDPTKAGATPDRLTAAHAEALRQYHRTDLKYDYERVGKAISLLEASGIQDVLTRTLPGLSDKGLAGILNDYGFFLAKGHRAADASAVFKRVIQLDPTRTIAYLNLGDILRSQLPEAATFQDKRALTSGIKAAYTRYKQLGGRANAAAEAFLALNILDQPPTDVCTYAATYASQGRLQELIGPGGSVAKANGPGTMRVEFLFGRLPRMPSISFIDNDTNEEAERSEGPAMPDDEEDSLWRWVEDVAVVPFMDGHHLLYYEEGDYLVGSWPIGAARKEGRPCRFTVRVLEAFDQKGPHADVCQLVQSPQRPPYLAFDTSQPVTPDALQAAGYTETAVRGAGRVDMNNDGTLEHLVLLDYSSGAGAGCGYQF